jgi:hypothetical protein
VQEKDRLEAYAILCDQGVESGVGMRLQSAFKPADDANATRRKAV